MDNTPRILNILLDCVTNESNLASKGCHVAGRYKRYKFLSVMFATEENQKSVMQY